MYMYLVEGETEVIKQAGVELGPLHSVTMDTLKHVG